MKYDGVKMRLCCLDLLSSAPSSGWQRSFRQASKSTGGHSASSWTTYWQSRNGTLSARPWRPSFSTGQHIIESLKILLEPTRQKKKSSSVKKNKLSICHTLHCCCLGNCTVEFTRLMMMLQARNRGGTNIDYTGKATRRLFVPCIVSQLKDRTKKTTQQIVSSQTRLLCCAS